MSEAAELRIGLIGSGAISTQHVEAIGVVDGVRLTALASATAERARTAGARWGVPWTTDVDELLARSDVDAVAICTPSGLHAGQATAALRYGKHVLIEKPIALSVADADAIITQARDRGLVVGTVSQRRFEPVMRRLHEALMSGALGRPVLIAAEGLYARPQSYYDSAQWRGTIALDGGVLMNQAIHLVDLVRWMGGPVESVSGQVATLGHAIEAEDTAAVTLRFTNGTLGAIVATTCALPGLGQRLYCYGDAGHVRIVGDEAVEWEVPAAPAPMNEESAPDEPPAPAMPHAGATWGTDAAGHIRQYADFLSAIREGRAPTVTADDGRNAVEIIVAAYESNRSGRTVTLRDAAA